MIADVQKYRQDLLIKNDDNSSTAIFKQKLEQLEVSTQDEKPEQKKWKNLNNLVNKLGGIIVQKYIEEEFSAELKKLTRTEGQILIKLIHRQTGHTTFALIKELKSGWRAFWFNNTARLFDINLKKVFTFFISKLFNL